MRKGSSHCDHLNRQLQTQDNNRYHLVVYLICGTRQVDIFDYFISITNVPSHKLLFNCSMIVLKSY